MKKSILLAFICFSAGSFAQETMKAKLKPLIEKYLKTEPLYRNCIINEVTITNISIIDEKEKTKSLYDFYHATRLKEIDQISFIKSNVEFIEQHCLDNRELFKKNIDEMNATLKESVPLVDSLWLIEEKYKTAPATSSSTEFYLVTFTFVYTLNNSKVTEKNHRMMFTGQFDIIQIGRAHV